MKITLKNEDAKKYTKNEVILIILEYIKEQKELSLRLMLSDDSFDKPAWSEHQAYQLGFQKALNKLETFIPDPEESV